AVIDRDDRAGLREGGVGAALGAGLLGLCGRVDHRMAVLPLLRLRALALWRAHQPGLDPKLPETQALVRVEVDDRPGEQIVVVVPGVLEQMPAELLGERGFVVLESLVVVGTEPDGVLVGHVDALHRGRLVSVHLLRELAGDLDRLHAGAEGAREHALDEALDASFKVAQNADLRLLGWMGWPPPPAQTGCACAHPRSTGAKC